MTSLQETYTTLKEQVAHFLGFNLDSTQWSTNEAKQIGIVMRSGYRLFLHPHPLPGERQAHVWSFLSPQGYLKLKPSVNRYTMPHDFAAFMDRVLFEDSDVFAREIKEVNEGQLRLLQQQDVYTHENYYPQFYSLTDSRDASGSQRKELLLYPDPDSSYTLTFRYMARQEELSDANPFPLGGAEHSELVLAAMLYASESYLDDNPNGPKYDQYMKCLQHSVHLDRKLTGPSNLGYNGDGTRNSSPYFRTRLVTLEAYPE